MKASGLTSKAPAAKIVPLITTPALIPGGVSKPLPMPIIARPAVPIVPQEIPVASDTITHNNNAVARKKLGVMIDKPAQIRLVLCRKESELQ